MTYDFSLERPVYFRCSFCGHLGVKDHSEFASRGTLRPSSIVGAGFQCSQCKRSIRLGYSLTAKSEASHLRYIYIIHPVSIDLLGPIKIVRYVLFISRISGLDSLDYAHTLYSFEELRRDLTRFVKWIGACLSK